jgi:hypothetical protein
MHPNRKTTRPQNPPLTRRQLHEHLGKTVCDFLLKDPKASHYPAATAEWLVAEVMEHLIDLPYY